MQGPGGQRRRGRGARGRAQGTAAALAAALRSKDDAAGAFYEMDQAQRFVTARVALLADLDPEGAAPAQTRLATLNHEADASAAAYITLVDAHDLDATEGARPGSAAPAGPGGAAAYGPESRSAADLDAIRRAFLGAAERMAASTRELNSFAASIAPQMDRLEAALDELPGRLSAARQALGDAERAVAAARHLHPAEPEALLATARAGFEQIGARGLGGLGVGGALAKAEEVRRLAGQAAETARELPRLEEKLDRDLVAVRTRVEVVAGRAEPVAEAMRQLRRRFSQQCWQDLNGAERSIQDAVERARERIAEASAAAARHDVTAARRALTAARTELAAADRRAGVVTGRLADLDAAAADPARPAQAARFAVRDAQRLAVSGPSGPRGVAPHHARALDALAARLETATQRLTGPRPDYWAYLSELEAITTAAHDVVGQIRAERAHPPRG